MIKGLLTVIFLSGPPQEYAQGFKTVEECKAKAEEIIPKLNKNPDVIGVAFVCQAPQGDPA